MLLSLEKEFISRDVLPSKTDQTAFISGFLGILQSVCEVRENAKYSACLFKSLLIAPQFSHTKKTQGLISIDPLLGRLCVCLCT